MENTLKTAVFVDDSKMSTDTVAIGHAVKVYDYGIRRGRYLHAGGLYRGRPGKLFISGESPIGKALIGAHVGDIVEAQTPGAR